MHSLNDKSDDSQITGYLPVLKLDSYYSDMDKRDFLEMPATPYHGFMRDPWARVFDSLIDRNAPHDFLRDYDEITRNVRRRPLSFGICQSVESLVDFYNKYFGGLEPDEEIVGIRSLFFENIGYKSHQSRGSIFLGYDVWNPSEWSIVENGICQYKDIYNPYSIVANKYGLLGSRNEAQEYINIHDELIKSGKAEPMADNYRETLEIVSVYRVHM